MPTFDDVDLDNAVSGTGFVHEDTTNTDYDNSSELRRGYLTQPPELVNGLVGWWPLHDDTAQDLSGNGNHGTLNGGVTTGVAGRGGLEAMSFDGNDGDIIVSPVPSEIPTGNETRTLSFWFKLDERPSVHGSNYHLANWGDTSDGEAFGLWVDNANDELVFFGWSPSYDFATGTILDSGVWYHAAVTHDGSKQTVYVNGTPIEEKSQSLSTGTTNFTIGTRMDNDSGSYLNGSICDTRIYNRALSDSEIQTLYEWGSGDYARPRTDGTSRYPFDTADESTEESVDDVEDGDVSEYTEQTGNTVSGGGLQAQTGTVYEGTYAISSNINDSTLVWTSTSGLPAYPSAGDTIRAQYRAAAGQSRSGFMFFTNAAGDQGYRVEFRYADGESRLTDLTNSTTLDSTTTLPPVGEWHELEVQTTSGGGFIGVTVTDSTGNTVLTMSGDSVAETSGGIGLYHSSANTDNTFYWDSIRRYDDTSSTDVWGSNDGTNNGATFVNDSIRGQAAWFQSSDGDYIEVSDDSTLSFATEDEFTLSAWVNPDTVSGTGSADAHHILRKGRSNSDDLEYAFRIGGGELVAFISDGNGSVDIITGGSIVTDGWQFATFVYSGDELRLYKSGANVASTSSTMSVQDSTSPLLIGSAPDGSGGTEGHFDGIIDDPRIYPFALEPHEVHDLYQWGTFGRDMRQMVVRA